MPSLRELQTAFACDIFDAAAEPAEYVRPGRFPAARHVQVYRNNVFTSLTGALQAVFPVIERLVGAGFFRYAAHTYIHRHPPGSGNLHDFGDAFADFLAGFAPAQTLPYLADVARLEWAWHAAFHAPDHPPLAPAKLAGVAPEHHGAIRFLLHPAAHLLASDYPVLRIWQVNQPDNTDVDSVDLSAGGVRLLLTRRGLAVEIESLDHADYALLHALAAGGSLQHATDAALAVLPAFDLAHALRRFVASDTLVNFVA